MLETPLHGWHVYQRGRMVDFAGWHMPVQYTSIVDEHHAVRTAVGLFDISHMGRLRFTGEQACAFLDHVVTNDVTRVQPGQIRYALVTNENGGILDDVLVYRCSDHYMLVVNASNREKIVEWLETHREGYDVQIEDFTRQQAMIAVQGPRALELLQSFVVAPIRDLGYYRSVETEAFHKPTLVSRTGYTGEDGFELIVANEDAITAWTTLVDAGEKLGALPCGLGSRDTLRLEAAMPLYGHELNEQIDPITAGLSFGVKLQAGDFIGRDALLEITQRGPRHKRIGLELEGRRIAREECSVHSGDTEIGYVTSGTFSPTLKKSIAMAYVKPDFSEPGTSLEVDIRGKRASATVVPLPFYSRTQ